MVALVHRATPLCDLGQVSPEVVTAHARRAGLDGHSLRSGFLTTAAALGASIFKMADQSLRL